MTIFLYYFLHSAALSGRRIIHQCILQLPEYVICSALIKFWLQGEMATRTVLRRYVDNFGPLCSKFNSIYSYKAVNMADD